MWYAIVGFIDLISFLLLRHLNYPYETVLRYVFLFTILIFIAKQDYKERIIKNKYIGILLLGRIVFLAIECVLYPDYYKAIIITSLLGLVVGSGIFFIMSLCIKNSIGMGDVKIIGAVGFFIGFDKILNCMLLSLILFAVYSLVLMIMKKIKVKDSLPYAPFLTVATWLILVINL